MCFKRPSEMMAFFNYKDPEFYACLLYFKSNTLMKS